MDLQPVGFKVSYSKGSGECVSRQHVTAALYRVVVAMAVIFAIELLLAVQAAATCNWVVWCHVTLQLTSHHLYVKGVCYE